MEPPHVIVLPTWLLVLEIFQGLFATIVVAISIYGVYWVTFGAWCFALFTGLATWIVLLYARLSSRAQALRAIYNYWAILGIQIFMVIFWIGSMAALSALRSTFVIPTRITSCINYGFGDSVCSRKSKRELGKRAVATYSYLNLISGAAGLSAIIAVLFIISLTAFSIYLRRYRSSRTPATEPASEDMLEAHPMSPVSSNSTPQQPPYPSQQHYTPPLQHYIPTPPPQQAYSSPMQLSPYTSPPQPSPFQPPMQHHNGPTLHQQYHEAPAQNHMYPQVQTGEIYR